MDDVIDEYLNGVLFSSINDDISKVYCDDLSDINTNINKIIDTIADIKTIANINNNTYTNSNYNVKCLH